MIKTEPPDTVEAEVVIRVSELTILVRLVMLATLVITITARLGSKSVNHEWELLAATQVVPLTGYTKINLFNR